MNELKQAVDRYLAFIVGYFRASYPVTAKRFHGLFVNNPDGEFTFDDEPIVKELGVVVTQADLDHSKAIAQNSSTRQELFDVRDDRLHVWENATWTSTVVERDTVFKVGRLYYSPFTQKLFLFDTTYSIEQIKGTTV